MPDEKLLDEEDGFEASWIQRFRTYALPAVEPRRWPLLLLDEVNGLDDEDTFQKGAFQFLWGHTGTGKTDLGAVRSLLYGRSSLPRFQFILDTEGSWGQVGASKVRKGQPITRETPLLANPPRTTPGTAPEISDRQLSQVSYSPLKYLDIGLKWVPPLPHNRVPTLTALLFPGRFK